MSDIIKFTGQTTAGNESAFKRGKVVPPDAVNLAWVKSPELDPAINMVIIDTSGTVQGNTETSQSGIYYSNLVGKLEDSIGNQLITDEYPAIADTFSMEGDLTGKDLTNEYAFPYVHVSRFFHLDKTGLVSGTKLGEYNSPLIKVVDDAGNIYADLNGIPKFIINIIATYQPWPGISQGNIISPDQTYRVHAFVDTNTLRNLYLRYDKVEINENGDLINQEINYKEKLNPQNFYEKRPEEAEVADPFNVDKNWYATKSISLKQKLLGLPVTSTNGYEVVVPKKAIPDPRIFQLFSWRVVCTFTDNYNVSTDSTKPINCGVIVTNTDYVPDPNANLDNDGIDREPITQLSSIFTTISDPTVNTTNAILSNPLQPLQTPLAKLNDEYWIVDFDNITYAQLAQFDFLVWSPNNPQFDFSHYVNKINYFTNILGKVLFIDTNNYIVPWGLGVSSTGGINPYSGIMQSNSLPANYDIPSNVDSPAAPSTWMPQIFLGLVQYPTNFNPPPPRQPDASSRFVGGWASGSVPSTISNYLSYSASDGNTYWKSITQKFSASFNSSGWQPDSNGDILYKTNTGTNQPLKGVSLNNDTWLPPIFYGVLSNLPNPTPPSSAINWVQGTETSGAATGVDYLQYTDNTTPTAISYINSNISGSLSGYASVNPVISFSGDLDSIVNNLQNTFPGSYPNITLGPKTIGTNTMAGNYFITNTPAKTQNSTATTGATYNFPKVKINDSTASRAIKPTIIGQNLPVTNRTAISNSDNGATYDSASNIFDASSLNGWKIDTTEPISYLQTIYGIGGGKAQYLVDVPSNSNVLVSGQIGTLTTASISGSLNLNQTQYNDVFDSVTALTDLQVLLNSPSADLSNISNLTINVPSLPIANSGSVVVLSSIDINTNITWGSTILHDSLLVTLGVPTNTQNNFQEESTESPLIQKHTIYNGNDIDLTKPFNLAFATQAAILTGPSSISVTFNYYVSTPDSVLTTTSGNRAEVPFMSTVPMVIESGKLIISTMGIPQSVAHGIMGATKLMYNILLYATANRNLSTHLEQKYTSSFNISSKWQNSWAINITDFPDVLTDAEKITYDFTYMPEDSDTPIVVGQRKLSDSSCESLISQTLSDLASNSGTTNSGLTTTNYNDVVLQNEIALLASSTTATRTYSLEVTNSLIEYTHDITASTIPHVWTRAYTPILTVPPDLHTYIIRERSIKGDYGDGTYINASYPEEPYSCRVRSYIDSDNVGSLQFNWGAEGTALVTYDTQVWVPPKTVTTVVPTTKLVEVILHATDHGLPGRYVEYHLPYTGVNVPGAIQTYQDDNYYSDSTSLCWPFYGLAGSYQRGSGGIVVQFIQDALNYFNDLGYFTLPNSAHLKVDGSFGPITEAAVYRLQSFDHGFQAKYYDGIVDAETFSIIGSQILRSGRKAPGATDYTQFYNWPWDRIQYDNVSDGNPGTSFQKRSWSTGGPDYIWDLISITLDKHYSVHGIQITPWVEGASNRIIIDKIDPHIATNYAALIGPYNTANMKYQNLKIAGYDNSPVYIPFNSIEADEIFIYIAQDSPAYPGQSTRVLGVRDIAVYANIEEKVLATKTVTIPGYFATNVVSVVIPIAASGSGSASLAKDYIANIYPDLTGFGNISDIQLSEISWTSIFTDNAMLNSNITTNGLINISIVGAHPTLIQEIIISGSTVTVLVPGNWTSDTISISNLSSIGIPNGTYLITTGGTDTFTITQSGLTAGTYAIGAGLPPLASVEVNVATTGSVYFGPYLPVDNTYFLSGTIARPNDIQPSQVYWKSPIKNVNGSLIPDLGNISKTDGIKLLCNSEGNPIGFPRLPTNTSEIQRHYVSLSIEAIDTAASIQISFYDIDKKEFIVDFNGLPQMSYGDYISRGPNNIFIGVISTFELDTQTPLPNTDYSPPIPNSMIMPAYGVKAGPPSSIGMGKLPDKLSKDSMWPIPIRDGSFSQSIDIPNNSVTNITTDLYAYQGQSVTAYYSIPEAKNQSWSTLYGRPNIDIGQELPLILDQSTIQVRQPPILMHRQPTIYDTLADPVRPVFTVYTRPTINDTFTPLPWSNILDYDVSNGTIHLKDIVASLDPNLIAVDYTSTQNVYLFKQLGGDVINLNPFSNQNAGFKDKPIYVYILPTSVKDSNDNTIISIELQTLRYSFDPSIFNINHPYYDPLAIQLGIIYIATDFDVNDLVLLDTRKRGGGAHDQISNATLTSSSSDTLNYWDVSYGTGMSYQNGCFIIVRLPSELKNNFSENEITDIIKKNLSAGVQFSIEDSEGNDW